MDALRGIGRGGEGAGEGGGGVWMGSVDRPLRLQKDDIDTGYQLFNDQLTSNYFDSKF